EMSNCLGFRAMSLANLKQTKGFRTTSVSGVTCSRHNMMDCVLLTTLVALQIICFVVSYDIACQHAINFWKKMSFMPSHMQLKLVPTDMWRMVPHSCLLPYKPKCHLLFSFHWMPEVGKSNGKGIEQNLAFSNGTAGSIRLMGPGLWQATLENIFSFHNYDKELTVCVYHLAEILH
ncbi:hypothetical protein C8R45DRAFT_837704, partial [Mycena sanguinolenta]